MLVGAEWIIDVYECDADKLRDPALLQSLFSLIIKDLNLKPLNETWHKFGGEGGVTGLVMLTESHLACHTYPEYKIATFNLYCCRSLADWNWESNLKASLGAKAVRVSKISRGFEESLSAGGEA